MEDPADRQRHSADDPPPMAVAMEWVSRIFAVSAEMVLPGLLGKWLGERWGHPSLVLIGFAIGISLGLWHLIVMTKAGSNKFGGKNVGNGADQQRNKIDGKPGG
jgi:hypothetical protein